MALLMRAGGLLSTCRCCSSAAALAAAAATAAAAAAAAPAVVGAYAATGRQLLHHSAPPAAAAVSPAAASPAAAAAAGLHIHHGGHHSPAAVTTTTLALGAALRAAAAADAGPHAPPRVKALLVDAAGTLLVPRERTADVYLRYGRRYGVTLSEREVLQRFRSAYNEPWAHSRLRYVGDGRPFWRHIVAASTGCDADAFFEDVYRYYATPGAWRVSPGAVAALRRLRAAGVRLAVVSNFDTRLRPILAALGVAQLFDAVVVSAEVGAEKPNPVIFEAALAALGVGPDEVVHIGDDRRNDIWGARDAGIDAWLWGVDVSSFAQVARRVLEPDAADDE